MKARLGLLAAGVAALLLFFSCSRPPFTLSGVHVSVSTVSTLDRDGTLVESHESLGIFFEGEAKGDLQMEVISPDGLTSWIFPAEKRIVEKVSYYGRSNLTLGGRMPLPRGVWSMRVLNSDGRTLTEQFSVEKGLEAAPYQNSLDAEAGLLVLDESLGACELQLLGEKKEVLHRSTTTEQSITLTSLYQKWEKVRHVGLAWYDEGARAGRIVWYAL
ncbi:MAG: hypothetical protein RBR15_15835 [Sphaerochaeta sp.]|nr:hypothetical protein [Sphaerochaeta sp.]